MSGHEFDSILDYLCSGILNYRERQRVRDELYDHLMSEYETGIAVGKSEEQSVRDAQESLGDRAEIRMKLSKVHSYRPDISMKKAMWLLIAGVVLSTFHITFFEGMDKLEIFIGCVLTLTGVFCLSRSGGKLKKAFSLYIAYTAVRVSVYVAPFLSDIGCLNTVLSILSTVIELAGFIVLLCGLEELCVPYTENPEKKLRFFECKGMKVSAQVTLAVWSAVSVLTGADATGMSVIPLGIAWAVMTIILYVRINRLLYKSDHEYRIEDSPLKKTAFACGVILISALIYVSVNVLYMTAKPKTEDFSSAELVLTENERDEIRETLKTYGMDEELISLIPDCEIENCRDVRALNSDELCSCDSVSGDFEVKYFALHTGDRNDEYRIIRFVNFYSSVNFYIPAKGYRTGYVTDNECFMPLNDGKQLVCCVKKNAETDEAEYYKPLKVYFSWLGAVQGAEYSGENGVVLMIAENVCIHPGENESTMLAGNDMGVVFRVPFTGINKSVKYIAENKADNPFFGTYRVSPVAYRFEFININK